jgi:hypothetical protein
MTGTPRATPALLWSRATLLAAVVVVVSSLGHVWADGLLPGPVAMAGLLIAAVLVSARFLTRQASTPRLVGLLVAGQAAIHGALSLLAGHGVGHGVGHADAQEAAVSGARFVFDGRQVERTGSYFDQVEAMQSAAPGAAAAAPGQAGWAHLADHLATQSVPMLLAHLAAVVLLAVWLAHGERALWTVLTLAGSRVLDVVAHSARVPGQSVGLLLERVRRALYLGDVGRPVVPLPHLLHHVVAHRGPPVLLVA